MSKPVTINMNPLHKPSGSIKAHGYNPNTKTLAIQFNSGQTYHYHGVEQDTVDKLIKADSVGKFLQSNIVGKYKHSKQDEVKSHG